MNQRFVRAGALDICYEDSDAAGAASTVILLHGFPYDVRAYDGVRNRIAGRCRTIVPYLRGFGETRFADASTPRSGQQAALGADLLAFMDALGIERAILAGYDWGGRAACVAAALHPERVLGLVTCGGYNIQNLAKANEPVAAELEHGMWYQYYLHGERGRTALETRRDEFCRHLWKTWSPQWIFDDAAFAQSARSFANEDFVDVVVHSYRHRFNLVDGDPAYDALERALRAQPTIDVPTIDLHGTGDGIRVAAPEATPAERAHFGSRYDRRLLAKIGHNVPQEAPAAFASAVLELA